MPTGFPTKIPYREVLERIARCEEKLPYLRDEQMRDLVELDLRCWREMAERMANEGHVLNKSGGRTP